MVLDLNAQNKNLNFSRVLGKRFINCWAFINFYFYLFKLVTSGQDVTVTIDKL